MKLSILKEILREVIREELREVLREELSTPTTPSLSVLVDDEPLYETPKRRNLAAPKTNNPLLDDLLMETANSDWRSIGHFGANQAQSFMPQQVRQQMFTEPKATSVENFIQRNSTPGAQDIRQVQINDVPDFSAMMNTMKSKGML
jgi:hypothetical protein